MTTATLTLADFLLARIAEDERVAQTIEARGRWAWREFATAGIYGLSDDQELSPYFSIDLSRGFVYPTASVMEHIKRQDPARVLAEVEAKRRIVVRCSEMQLAASQTAVWLASRTLADLALPYADHPDYREEWRP